MRTVLFIFVIVTFFTTINAFGANYELCMIEYEDGSKRCAKVVKSASIDGCRMYSGRTERENGKLVVNKYRVSACNNNSSHSSGYNN